MSNIQNNAGQEIVVPLTGDTNGFQDVAALNAALLTAHNLGGGTVSTAPGVYYLNQTLTIYSNTKFNIGAGSELRCVTGGPGGSNTFLPLINANANSAPMTIASITSAAFGIQMSQITVNFNSAHGLQPGNFLEIKWDASQIYEGIWEIYSTPNSTSLTFLMGLGGGSQPPATATSVASASQTVASPGVFTTAANAFVAGQCVQITGTAPGGFSTGTFYFVIATGLTSTTCQLATSPTGTGIQCTSSSACTIVPYIFGAAADGKIAIGGGGKINCQYGAAGFTSSGNTNDHAMLMRRVLKLTIDGLHIQDARKYSMLLQDTYNPTVKNIYGTTNADGVFIYGPCWNPVVDNVSGSFGDDCCPVNTVDGTTYGLYLGSASLLDTGGNIWNGFWRNIYPKRCANVAAVVFYPSSNLGTSGNTAPLYQMYGEQCVDGAGFTDPTYSNWSVPSVVGFGGGYLHVSATMENVSVKNIKGTLALNSSASGIVLNIGSLTIENWVTDATLPLGGLSNGLVVNIDYLNIQQLTIKYSNLGAQNAPTMFTLGSANCTIDRLNFISTRFFNYGVSSGYTPHVLTSNGATLNKMTWRDCTFGPRVLGMAFCTFANTPNVDFVGCKGDSGYVGAFLSNAGSYNINIRDCISTNPTLGFLDFASGTGTINISASGLSYSGTLFANFNGTINVYNPDGSMPVDVGLLATTKGQCGYHLSSVAGRNAANQQGLFVGVDGTHFYAIGTGTSGVNTLIV